MAKTYKKSAKDIAFDKERATFRKALREAEHEKKDIVIENIHLKNQIETLQNELSEKQRVIDTLMTTQKLSPDDLQKLLQRCELQQHMADIFKAMSNVNKYI